MRNAGSLHVPQTGSGDRDIPALWVRAFTPNGGRGKGEAGPWMEGKARKATRHFF